MIVQHSKVASSAGVGTVCKWSNTHMESHPSSWSAACAALVMASYFSIGSTISARSMRQPCGTKTPNLIATFHLPFLPVQDRVRANYHFPQEPGVCPWVLSSPKTQYSRLPVTWRSRMLVLPLIAPWTLVRLDRRDADQLVRVGHQMDGLDNAVSHVEDDCRDRSPFQGSHDAWPPVHLHDAKVDVG